MSSYRSRGIVAIGVVMASLAAFVIAYAAQISTPETNSAGQGVTVTEGYTAGTVSYSGGWADTTSNDSTTNVGTASFPLTQTNGALVTSAETTVYAQLTGGTSSNWTLCTIPTAGNVTCDFSSASKPMSSVTGIDIVAQGDALPAVNPPDEPEAEASVFVASDGSLDTSFNPGAGVSGGNSRVDAITPLSDGKILIGGSFATYNGTARSGIARINSDGSLDTSFNPGTGILGSSVPGVVELPDGKILIAGSFSQYNGTLRRGIARLNANGSLDTSFDPGTGFKNIDGAWLVDGGPESIAVLDDGKILVVGQFTRYNEIVRNRVARLNADGSLDTSFDLEAGVDGFQGDEWYTKVSDFAIQSDGKVVIGGRFPSYRGVARNNIARINADGSLDTSFNPGTGTGAYIEVASIALQPDGRIIIGGDFTTYNGVTSNRIARLNADGSLDAGFNTGTGANGMVSSVTLQPDGKILIGGTFTSYDGVTRNRIARLNADGSLDTSFDPGTGADSGVQSFALQSDGKILIGGSFTTYNGVTRNRIARLGLLSSPPTEPALGSSFEVATLDAGDGTSFSGGVSTSGAELFVLTNSSPAKVLRFDQPALTNKGTLSLE